VKGFPSFSQIIHYGYSGALQLVAEAEVL